MKGQMQIKKLFINATLSKNQMYNLKNQINKVPTISKQDEIEFFPKYFSRHFTDVMSSIYFRVFIMVGFSFADTRGLC